MKITFTCKPCKTHEISTFIGDAVLYFGYLLLLLLFQNIILNDDSIISVIILTKCHTSYSPKQLLNTPHTLYKSSILHEGNSIDYTVTHLSL